MQSPRWAPPCCLRRSSLALRPHAQARRRRRRAREPGPAPPPARYRPPAGLYPMGTHPIHWPRIQPTGAGQPGARRSCLLRPGGGQGAARHVQRRPQARQGGAPRRRCALCMASGGPAACVPLARRPAGGGTPPQIQAFIPYCFPDSASRLLPGLCSTLTAHTQQMRSSSGCPGQSTCSCAGSCGASARRWTPPAARARPRRWPGACRCVPSRGAARQCAAPTACAPVVRKARVAAGGQLASVGRAA